MDVNSAFDGAVSFADDAEERGYNEGVEAGYRLAVCDGYKLGSLSGDVAWEEVGAYSAWADVVLMLEQTDPRPLEPEQRGRGNRSAVFVAEACAAFPVSNEAARASGIEVGQDLQRIRARSKAMLAAAGLTVPDVSPGSRSSPRADGQDAASGDGPPSCEGAGGSTVPQAGTRGVPIAGAAGVDLQF